jgi:hypothetical protein
MNSCGLRAAGCDHARSGPPIFEQRVEQVTDPTLRRKVVERYGLADADEEDLETVWFFRVVPRT